VALAAVLTQFWGLVVSAAPLAFLIAPGFGLEVGLTPP
jgi:hypothetical protein